MKFCQVTRELCKHAQRKNRSIVLTCAKADNESLAKLKKCPLVKYPPEVEHLGI